MTEEKIMGEFVKAVQNRRKIANDQGRKKVKEAGEVRRKIFVSNVL
ncbi:MAG TPA: hypothetical protein VL485_10660 [Ktedonobacteraceae bacterium]|nr:hypothetical protein [Ktedonobacteraceae bacterium]